MGFNKNYIRVPGIKCITALVFNKKRSCKWQEIYGKWHYSSPLQSDSSKRHSIPTVVPFLILNGYLWAFMCLIFRQKLYYTSVFTLLLLLGSCTILKESPKTSFVDGIYLQKDKAGKQKVYADIEDETIRIFSVTKSGRNWVSDSSRLTTSYPKYLVGNGDAKSSFSKYSLDLDFITIPLKYRFATNAVPQQLNANINGAVFLGYRTDRYSVTYKSNPIKLPARKITHYGFSFGICTGLGNTDMNATNTSKRLASEYDGLVWNKGVAAIIAIDNFTMGLVCGFDNLLDQHSKIWIYENKPWIGLGLGLNLN